MPVHGLLLHYGLRPRYSKHLKITVKDSASAIKKELEKAQKKKNYDEKVLETIKLGVVKDLREIE